MTDDHKQIVNLETLVAAAEQALGQVLVKHMPLATSGDVDPWVAYRLDSTIRVLATTWCEVNASDHYIMPDQFRRENVSTFIGIDDTRTSNSDIADNGRNIKMTCDNCGKRHVTAHVMEVSNES